MALTKAQQTAVDQAVQLALKGAVAAESKPHLVDDLRKTWRKSAEHKAAQVKRFVYSLAAVVGANVIGDISTGKNPLTHFTDVRTAWYYLIPFAYIAWKQAHPSMSASEVDAAPGATIVPDQLDSPAVPAVDPTVVPPDMPEEGSGPPDPTS